MGFALLPEPLQPGVYYSAKLDWLLVIENYFLVYADCWYKKRQRGTKILYRSRIDEMGFKRIGDF